MQRERRQASYDNDVCNTQRNEHFYENERDYAIKPVTDIAKLFPRSNTLSHDSLPVSPWCVIMTTFTSTCKQFELDVFHFNLIFSQIRIESTTVVRLFAQI